jgi:hypothetical protein
MASCVRESDVSACLSPGRFPQRGTDAAGALSASALLGGIVGHAISNAAIANFRFVFILLHLSSIVPIGHYSMGTQPNWIEIVDLK